MTFKLFFEVDMYKVICHRGLEVYQVCRGRISIKKSININTIGKNITGKGEGVAISFSPILRPLGRISTREYEKGP